MISGQQQNENEAIIYKTKLSDGRYIVISDDASMADSEYLIIVDSQPILTDKRPALLRKRNIGTIDFFIRSKHRYIKTELSSNDSYLVRLLISNTPLNNFNVLFAKVTIED